jgi:two-component system sensor histidine kinase/response regulator
MKYLQQRLLVFHGKIKSIGLPEAMGYLQQGVLQIQSLFKSIDLSKTMASVQQNLIAIPARIRRVRIKEIPTLIKEGTLQFLLDIKELGFTESMDDYEKRKLGIFNQLNFLQLATGILVPLVGLSGYKQLPPLTWVCAISPAFVSLSVLWLNGHRKYTAAHISYFLVYPFLSSVVYMSGLNLGVELFFILYGVLSVFFLQNISQMLFSVSLSMISYFILAVVCESFIYELKTANYFFYLFNELLAIILIYYGLYLVKKENSGYQFSILNKNRTLHKNNLEIQQQQQEIAEKAALLSRQTEELKESNAIKDKLFSVISHDLKSPMYALRNLFRNMKEYDVPAEDIKNMIPEVVNDLNFTTSLMDNLLQWARTQMQADSINAQSINITELIDSVLKVLRLQADAKKITVESNVDHQVFSFADKDMIHLVLRNLVSNSIKFTPEGGSVTVHVYETSDFVEVAVEDTGMGISPEALAKINQNNYYTTKGTASESGTGLGLMLCREFVTKNGGFLRIESEPGNGSIFSFTLPKSK